MLDPICNQFLKGFQDFGIALILILLARVNRISLGRELYDSF